MVRNALLAVLLTSSFGSAYYFGSPDMAGNSQSLLGWGSPATGTPTISASQFRPGQAPGKHIGHVNGFTGQASYTIPLGALNARGTVSFPITLNYSGSVRAVFNGDRLRGATGWVGMGWGLTMPQIAVNHKGTYASSDDVIFADLGPFGGGQFLQAADVNKTFFLSTNPTIKITPTLGTGEFLNQVVTWTLQLPDGKKLVFGSTDNSRRMVFHSHNVIKAVPYAGITSQRFIYRWDIASISDFTGANTILFDYNNNFKEDAGQGRLYDRESYVKNIRWNGPNGAEAERYEFITAAKITAEYYAYPAGESKDDQRPYETQYLERINCFKEGKITHHFQFTQTPELTGSGEAVKRNLTQIKVFRYDNGQGPPVEDRGWGFSYYDLSRYFLLNDVYSPDGQKVSFTYKEANFTGKEGDVAPGDFLKEDDNQTYLALPTDNTKLAKWKNVSRCDDRFCYTLIKDGDDVTDSQGRKEKLYAEIRPNMGNYFDTASNNAVKRFESSSTTSTAAELDLIPAGDYFLWVNYKYGSVELWEWDDGKMVQRSPFSGDARYSGNFQHTIKVYPGGDYFVVHKTAIRTTGTTAATPAQIIVVKRLPGGQWTSLNRDPAVCQFDNKGSYGETIRPSGAVQCMDYSSDDLLVSATPNYFTVVHKPTDIINLYGTRPDGQGFVNQTLKLPVVASGQRSGFPMNWEVHVEELVAHHDYFVLFTTFATQAVQAFYYSGDQVYPAGVSGGMSGGHRTLWTSQNYFLEKNASNQFWFWEKRWDGSTVQFVRSSAEIPTLRPSNYNTRATLVRTHPKGFTIEYYDHADSIGCRPSVAGDRSAVNLFQVDKAHPGGFIARSDYLATTGHMFDISFASEEHLFMKRGKNSFGGPCAAGQGCTVDFMAVSFYPRNTNIFMGFPFDPDHRVPTLAVSSLKEFQNVFSGSSIAMRTILDLTARRVRWEPFQWGGKGYARPRGHFVVDQVTTSAGLGSNAKDNVTHQYVYDRQTSWRVEFNSNLQLPQFEVCEVKQVNSLGANLGGSLTVFHTDVLSKPLSDTTLFLSGTERSTTTFGTASADTVVKSDQVMTPHRNTSWPSDLFVNRLYKTTVKHISSNRAHRTTATSYHRYNDNNGAPHFTVGAMGPGPHPISQAFFDGLHLPSQSIQFLTPTYPDTNLLRTAVSTTSTLSSQTGFTTLTPVSSSRTLYNSNFLPVRLESWRDFDDAMTEANMKLGATPAFNLNEGWIQAGEVTQRNPYNQPIESRVVKSGNLGDETHTSVFYEGRMSLPVATVSNAKLDNCAVLLGENGGAGLTGLDYPGRWTRPGVSFESALSHTGRGSLRVTDSYGPTINLYLKDVRTKNLSMTVSAWIYAENGTTPILLVERRNAAGAGIDAFLGEPAPYGWSEAQNRWQRWTVTVSNAQLISGNLFNGANDFLRIWVGTGEPGVPGRSILVDDIVILPTNATFSTSTHDYRGISTSRTTNDHLSAFFDLDIRGGVMAVRDHRKRIFSQQGFHFVGEN